MEANTLFDFPKVEITKPIRLIEAFGGIGSQAMALRDIGANFEHYRLIEFDPKYADVIRKRWTTWAIENHKEIGKGGLK